MHSSSRRDFLRKTALVATGSALMGGKVFSLMPRHSTTLGLQLYTVRKEMKNDPLGTLQQLSRMGYLNVEHANYSERKFYGFKAAEFKKILEDLGMKMPSGHTPMGPEHWDKSAKDFTDAWKWTVEDAALAGQQYVISPWLEDSLRKTYDDLVGFLDIFNRCGELCRKSGMKFGYHNHNFEFNTSINNVQIFDIILQHTDPALVAQQLDIGNMYGAGGRAMDLIKKYPGRFELMHVKDEIKSTTAGEMEDGYESTILGQGVLGVRDILAAAAAKGGTTRFIIEQESYQLKTPLEAAAEDLQVMKKWGY